MNPIMLWMILAVVGVASVIYVAIFHRKKHGGSGNVVFLHEKRKERSMKNETGRKSGKSQLCSKCKQRRPLLFYANEAGAVKGLCKECKKAAERQEELYPV